MLETIDEGLTNVVFVCLTGLSLVGISEGFVFDSFRFDRFVLKFGKFFGSCKTLVF